MFERVNEDIKRRNRAVDTFHNAAAITRLVAALLKKQHEHWKLEGRQMFSAESMAEITALEQLPSHPRFRKHGLEQTSRQAPVERRCEAALLSARGQAPTGAANNQP